MWRPPNRQGHGMVQPLPRCSSPQKVKVTEWCSLSRYNSPHSPMVKVENSEILFSLLFVQSFWNCKRFAGSRVLCTQHILAALKWVIFRQYSFFTLKPKIFHVKKIPPLYFRKWGNPFIVYFTRTFLRQEASLAHSFVLKFQLTFYFKSGNYSKYVLFVMQEIIIFTIQKFCFGARWKF